MNSRMNAQSVEQEIVSVLVSLSKLAIVCQVIKRKIIHLNGGEIHLLNEKLAHAQVELGAAVA